jgi:hypothetical protein
MYNSPVQKGFVTMTQMRPEAMSSPKMPALRASGRKKPAQMNRNLPNSGASGRNSHQKTP